MAAGGEGVGGPWAEGGDERPSHLGSATARCAGSGQTCLLTSAWPCHTLQTLCTQVDGGPVRTVAQHVRPCSLDEATQKLITNIFSKAMFSDAMARMNLGEDPGAWPGAGAQGVAAG